MRRPRGTLTGVQTVVARATTIGNGPCNRPHSHSSGEAHSTLDLDPALSTMTSMVEVRGRQLEKLNHARCRSRRMRLTDGDVDGVCASKGTCGPINVCRRVEKHAWPDGRDAEAMLTAADVAGLVLVRRDRRICNVRALDQRKDARTARLEPSRCNVSRDHRSSKRSQLQRLIRYPFAAPRTCSTAIRPSTAARRSL